MRDRCVYILAAGSSKRFGRDKLLEKIEGMRIIDRVIRLAEIAGSPTLIVRPDFPDLGVRKLINPNHEKGISSSVKVAIEDAKERGCKMVVFFLGDMPLISEETVKLVLKKAEESNKLIVFPEYGEKKGFPTVVKEEAFEFLEELEGDEGFRRVIKNHPEICESVVVKDKWCVFDVDTPDDLKRAAHMGRSG